MIHVTDAKYVDGYKIHLKFSDQKEGILDLKNVIFNDHRSIFKELIDLQKFKKFKIAADTIVWENGLDLAPEFLHEKMLASEK